MVWMRAAVVCAASVLANCATGVGDEVVERDLEIVSGNSITALYLVDANAIDASDTGVGDLVVLTDGARIDLDDFPGVDQISVRAAAGRGTQSVVFSITGRTENVAPYALAGDTNGDFNAWSFTLGRTYELTATPYSADRGTGTRGTPKTVRFTLLRSGGGTPDPGDPSPDFPALRGRIAISSDGNMHDRDDMLATAVSVAILAKSGNASKLVYYGHSDHFWYSNRTSEEIMRVSAEDTARMWGGFNMNVFYNVTREKGAAKAALVAEINRSTSSNPLWLIGAGPMEFIGQALQSSNASARRYVNVISHSTWNDEHADNAIENREPNYTQLHGWSFRELGSLGVRLVDIPDQNNYLNESYSDFYWLRDSRDSRLRWLWDRGQVAAKPRFDTSDSGMTYYVISGGDVSCNTQKLRSLFL